ncbi:MULTISPECIES: DUF982 domain-containing protein [Mesorhizobium]|uniref:DUF982 domain-containing protein n=1 Tax=Mesorhizobium sp. 10.2.3 TaxID=1085775 RepID=UPI0010A97C3F|nr:MULTISPECIES: DUF982 domain-containing protein [Mesorhizobium]
MSLLWFTPKVPVKTRAGHRRLISNVQAASKELLTWALRGPQWNRAARVCISTWAREATPQEARRCLRLAAVEEGRLLPRVEEDS